ncbi:hypothetical protein BGZ94_009319 [Podila epigama]|nr:hypothetical protein BGZ94_009319 [Podila epigama]
MVSSTATTRSSTPHRTQRALSMASETRRARDALDFSGDYPYTHHTFQNPPMPNHPYHLHAPSASYAPSIASTSSSSSTPSPSSSPAPSHSRRHPSASSNSNLPHDTQQQQQHQQLHQEPASLFGVPDDAFQQRPAQHNPPSIFGTTHDVFHRPVTPQTTPEQRKDAKIAQRQRREQIVLMLQQQQIEAQEKAKQEKLDRQQAKLERKQKRAELKEMQLAQLRQEQGPYSPQLPDIQHQAGHGSRDPNQKGHTSRHQHSSSASSTHSITSQYYQYHYNSGSNANTNTNTNANANTNTKFNNAIDSALNSSTSSSGTTSFPRDSQGSPDRMRSLSLKSSTKSMYDLRPWSGGSGGGGGGGGAAVPPLSPTVHDGYSGYESDDASGSHGWDSLMETLHSPTTASTNVNFPSDTVSWDSKEDIDSDLIDSLGGLGLGCDGGNGNGKYLLVLGANGRTGLELVRQGLERNYRVTAFVRDDKLLLEDSSLRKNQNLLIVRGSPTSQKDLDSCVEGQDVVVNVIGARLMTGDTTISSHSQVVLNNAMRKHGLRNTLINTRRLFSRMFMTGILKDKVLQEDIIQRDTAHLDWTIVRPITLKDGDLSKKYIVSSCELPSTDKIKLLTRKDLAHYLLSIINRRDEFGAIRSIAGKPKVSKSSPFCPFDRRREAAEQNRLLEFDLQQQQQQMSQFEKRAV